MITPDVPETGMASGTDAGEIGERHEPTAAGAESGVAVEDTPEAVSAVDDDSVLPPQGGADQSRDVSKADDLTPVYLEPQAP